MTAEPGACTRRVLLLTGRPGIGKTTVLRRLAELLSGRTIAGFYTDEIRERGRRVGFRATAFSGASCVSAHTSLPSRRRVGRYGVDVAAFEQLVLPEFARPCDVTLIDEIGKMECFSDRFVKAVRSVLDGPKPVIATVAVSGSGFIEEVKAREDVEIANVTVENRDALPSRLHARLRADGRL